MHRPTKSLLICLLLTLCNGFSVGCRWMDDHKFLQHSETLMNLLNIMGGEFTTDSVDIPFPEDLYEQAEHLPTDDTIWFILQTLDKIAELFDGELHSVWDEKKVEIFLNVLTSQSDGLQSCVRAQKKNSKNLQMYFKRLNNHVLKRMAYSAHAWELVRKEVRTHLRRLVLLGSATENSI
ncbi:interferon phi 4 isoform X1 [Oncorhynchus keta]|uniref:interferon phi 4 isoform X1 n=1 Tax=Oncorhynchus keta TaxID=8018 RepID=UPI0015F9FBC7|nr:interferon phi 4 isoform X1 [Oncorhynchus keta]